MATKPRVALVHDWLYGGGAEQVVLQLHRLFPDAPIYTSYCTDEWRQKLDNKVITGYLQRWPFRNLRKFLPILRQRWFRKLDLSDYDIVLSSSGNGEAKFINVNKPAVHICYSHTPTHFYWRHYDQYLKDPGVRPKWLARLGLRLLIKPLRQRDYEAAQKVDYFIANSNHIKDDIKQYYNRDSVVIHPPVDIKRLTVAPAKKRQGFITLGRQTPYKKTDIIIEACNGLNLPLTVSGQGPEHERLLKIGGPTVDFQYLSDQEMAQRLSAAEAFIFAAHEDFGIAPVEAMAAGTPVIAYKAGGALDYVVPGLSGEFFDKQSVKSLTSVLQQFDTNQYDAEKIQHHATMFSNEVFATKIMTFLKDLS